MFHCDNNVVDHQVINHEYDRWDNDELYDVWFYLVETSRYAKFMGTKGELIVDMQPDEKESKIS